MIKKILLIALAAVVLLFLALAWYVQTDAFSRMITPLVRSTVERTLSKDILIGTVKARLVPLSLEARDLIVLDDEYAPSATVRKARATVNPLALLLGEVRVSRITVTEPRLSLAAGAGGGHSFSRFAGMLRTRKVAAAGQAPPRFAVRIARVSVRRGIAQLTHRPSSSRVVVTDLSFDVRGGFGGGPVSLDIRDAAVAFSTAAVQQQVFSLRASARYDRGMFDIKTLDLDGARGHAGITGRIGSFPGAAADLSVHASIYLQEIDRTAGRFGRQRQALLMPAIDVDATIRGPLATPVLIGSAQGRNLEFRDARASAVRLEYSYRDRVLAFGGKQWRLERRGRTAVVEQIIGEISYSGSSFSIDRFGISGAGFGASADGTIDLKSGYAVDMLLEMADAGRVAGLFSKLPVSGAARIRGRWTGPLGSPRFAGRLHAGPLTVRGVEFSSVEGICEVMNRKVWVRDAEIRQAVSRYLFNGTADLGAGEIEYEARLDAIRADVAPVVALFYKPIPLDIVAKGEVLFSGTGRRFEGTAHLVTGGGRAYGETFSSGSVTAVLEPKRIVFTSVEVFKGSGVVKGNGWIGFDRNYAAWVQARFVDLSEVNIVRRVPLAGAFRLDVESSGHFRNPSVIASLESDQPSLAAVPLGRSSAELSIQDHAFTLSARNANGLFGGQWRLGLRKPYPWSATLESHLQNIALPGRSVEGSGPAVRASLDGTASAEGTGFSLANVSGDASIEHLRLELGEYWIESTGRSRISMRRGVVELPAAPLKGHVTNITLSGRLRTPDSLDLSVEGSANMSLLRLPFRVVEHSEGNVDFRVTVDNLLRTPVVNGEIVVSEGALKIRDIPQTFTRMNGALSINDGRIVVESVTGELGGGGLQVSGWLQLSGLSIRDFAVRARSAGVTVRYPEGVVSTLNGDVYYDGNAKEQTLSGEVAIANARYEKRIEWKSMLLEMARGIYQPKKTETGWIGDTQLNMRFHGKESVLFQNNLAKVPLDVDVQLRGTINRPQLLGRIEASRGSVFFRNNDFTVLHASADFVDPSRLNPVLDIQAETRVREYLIRLSVSGTAEHALVTFLSDPPLSDADILGVLALGKTGSELKGRETGVGMGEAVSFATGQFQDIFEQRARSLTGLDRFQVDPYVSTGDTSVPRVTVGKEILRDRLYVTYSSNVGSTDAEPILKVEYLLNRNLSIVGEQDELGKIGADMKFRFEFK